MEWAENLIRKRCKKHKSHIESCITRPSNAA